MARHRCAAAIPAAALSSYFFSLILFTQLVVDDHLTVVGKKKININISTQTDFNLYFVVPPSKFNLTIYRFYNNISHAAASVRRDVRPIDSESLHSSSSSYYY